MIKLLKVYHKDKKEAKFVRINNDLIFKKDIFDMLIQASEDHLKYPKKNILERVESDTRITIVYNLDRETFIVVYSR